MKLPRTLLAMSLLSLLLGSAQADELKVGAAAPAVVGGARESDPEVLRSRGERKRRAICPNPVSNPLQRVR